MSQLAPTEIMALVRIMDELDYYQLMHVERGASGRDVKDAFYASSRSFHPDTDRHLEPTLRDAVDKIAKRVTEAYAVLRDPRRRQAYDRFLDGGDGLRIQLAEAEAGARRKAEEDQGRTPQGRQFWSRARQDIDRSDWAAAARNLQTALTFEPDNTFFRHCLAELRAKHR